MRILMWVGAVALRLAVESLFQMATAFTFQASNKLFRRTKLLNNSKFCLEKRAGIQDHNLTLSTQEGKELSNYSLLLR